MKNMRKRKSINMVNIKEEMWVFGMRKREEGV